MRKSLVSSHALNTHTPSHKINLPFLILPMRFLLLFFLISTVTAFNTHLGSCYYPEQWSSIPTKTDAIAMHQLGLTYTRIAEFSWSKIQPSEGVWDWEWLDLAIDELHSNGIRIILGTPTASPPKWLTDAHPSILPVNKQGIRMHASSRKQYSYSSEVYRHYSAKITMKMATRYGQHPGIVGWQIDNEFGWGNMYSYDSDATIRFRTWLSEKYNHSIDTLNEAWGTVFWSMTFDTFDAIELPFLTVADANPSALLDYYRFASDEVISFAEIQTQILRRQSPNRFITTNFMGCFTGFNHFRIAKLLDFASWDNYPLGFTSTFPFISQNDKQRYAKTGHPDIASFNHDLYSAISNGSFWVMEQQPGPVNWASNNPSPFPGMVRLWTWEAFAHGADTVSYFRWRRSAFAQEQMHTGLLRRDSSHDQGYDEARQVLQDMTILNQTQDTEMTSSVAIVFDYEAAWVLEIEPQGSGFGSYISLVFMYYTALRQLGIDVTFVSTDMPLNHFKVVIVPTLPIIPDTFLKHMHNAPTTMFLFGPRSGSKTKAFHVPASLAPGNLQVFIPLKVHRVESFAWSTTDTILWQNKTYTVSVWKEWINSSLIPDATFESDLRGALFSHRNVEYMAFYPTSAFLNDYLAHHLTTNGISTIQLPDSMRIVQNSNISFAFNYDNSVQQIPTQLSQNATFLIGHPEVPPHDITIFTHQSQTGSAPKSNSIQ